VSVRVTVPVKLPLAVTVMIELPVAPALTGTVVGLASRLMPPAPAIVTVTMVEFVMSLLVPPVPVIVTV